MMNEKEVEQYLDYANKEMENLKIKNLDLQNQYGQISSIIPNKDQNLAEQQLDLTKDLDRLYHLLSGHVLVSKNIRGQIVQIWDEPQDDRLKIFSDYGVKQIMNLILFYINRNTLLSYYDEATIKWKVRDFGIELADLLFNRYEVFFHYPSAEELFDKYFPIAKEQNMNLSEDELYWKCVQWSKEELQAKFRHYPSMCLAIIDSVDSTYRRALYGKERDTLRKFIHLSESSNPLQPFQQNSKQGGFKR